MSYGKMAVLALVCVSVLFGLHCGEVHACTGLKLITEDGAAVYGRTLEWGSFALNSEVVIVPRKYDFVGLTPDGKNGKKWQGKYGFVGINMLGNDTFIADGMNEKGLTTGLFYHPGYSEYMEYDPSQANNTITGADVTSYILSQFTTIDEVKEALESVRVVAYREKTTGVLVEAHWMVMEPSGKSIVIEYAKGELRIFDSPLGIITNAPTYDWHMTNLRNYVNLSPVAIPNKKIEDLDFTPLGGGSGMIGLPGDFTPPSRFVRVAAWSQTHRPLKDSGEAMYELFRILDNFNVPLGSAESAGSETMEGKRSATIWTTCWDTSEKNLYYHTQDNRRVREVQLSKVDFSKPKVVHIPLDEKKEQDINDVTPVD